MKIILLLALIVVIAVGGYFIWSEYRESMRLENDTAETTNGDMLATSDKDNVRGDDVTYLTRFRGITRHLKNLVHTQGL